MAKYQPKPCAACGAIFQPVNARSKYCSERCKMGIGICKQCGNEFIKKKGTTGQYCSPECWYKAPGKKIYTERLCGYCGTRFQPRWVDQKFCSEDCGRKGRRKERAFTHCQNCGKELPFKLSKRTLRFCSRKCALIGSTREGVHHAPLGHKTTGPSGYILIKVGKGEPGTHKSGWMLEHRFVMQQKLGRPLEPHERVHHKNGNRADNQPENLELWTVEKKDPAGQRQLDRIKEMIGKITQEEKRHLLEWLQAQL